MNHKLKISLIVLLLIGVVIAIPLIVLSFGRIEVGDVALCYDNILSNYSSTVVYGPGNYFIGVARSFIRIKRVPTTLRLSINTFTSDYFKLTSNISVTYSLTSPNNFTTLSDYYINFGPNPEPFFRSIIQKKSASILSQLDSTYYQSNYNATVLQNTIASQVNVAFLEDLDTSINVQVLIIELVVDGVSSNVEAIDKQIQNGLVLLQRAENQKAEFSTFMKNVKEKTDQQLSVTLAIIKERVKILSGLLDKAATYPNINISKVLFGNSVIKDNLSFYSSELKLRPELYTATQTSPF